MLLFVIFVLLERKEKKRPLLLGSQERRRRGELMDRKEKEEENGAYNGGRTVPAPKRGRIVTQPGVSYSIRMMPKGFQQSTLYLYSSLRSRFLAREEVSSVLG